MMRAIVADESVWKDGGARRASMELFESIAGEDES